MCVVYELLVNMPFAIKLNVWVTQFNGKEGVWQGLVISKIRPLAAEKSILSNTEQCGNIYILIA